MPSVNHTKAKKATEKAPSTVSKATSKPGKKDNVKKDKVDIVVTEKKIKVSKGKEKEDAAEERNVKPRDAKQAKSSVKHKEPSTDKQTKSKSKPVEKKKKAPTPSSSEAEDEGNDEDKEDENEKEGKEAEKDAEDEEEGDEEEILLHGFSSESDSSDEDDDVDTAPVDMGKLPTIAKDDATVKRRLEKAKKQAVSSVFLFADVILLYLMADVSWITRLRSVVLYTLDVYLTDFMKIK